MEKINSSIVENGITSKDLPLIRAWGYYLGLDDSEIFSKETSDFYKDQIEFLKKQLKPENKKLEKVSTSQLRKFFSAIKKIQVSDFEKVKHDITLLSAKLAYAVGRDIKKDKNKNLYYKTKIKELYELIVPLIEKVNGNENYFKNFVNVFEAIVAYHKEVSAESESN